MRSFILCSLILVFVFLLGVSDALAQQRPLYPSRYGGYRSDPEREDGYFPNGSPVSRRAHSRALYGSGLYSHDPYFESNLLSLQGHSGRFGSSSRFGQSRRFSQGGRFDYGSSFGGLRNNVYIEGDRYYSVPSRRRSSYPQAPSYYDGYGEYTVIRRTYIRERIYEREVR